MNLDKDFKVIQDKVDKLQELADTVVQPFIPMEKYSDVESNKYKWSKYTDNIFGNFNLRTEYYFKKSNSWSSDPVITTEYLDKVLEQFDYTVEEWKQDNAEVHSKNQAAVEHNLLQKSRVIKIMETIGAKPNYSTWEYKTSRSSKMTETKHTSGYVSDLARLMPVDSAYQQILKQFEDKRKAIKSYGEAAILKRAEEAKKKAESEMEQRKIAELAMLRAKYTPDNAMSEPYDIRENLNTKDKYLALAYWLERNRGDWTDGYHYASVGLDQFTIESETDKEIYEEIKELCEDNSMFPDGRCFRDCEWNYNVLYSMVEDNQLVKDSEMLYGYEMDW